MKSCWFLCLSLLLALAGCREYIETEMANSEFEGRLKQLIEAAKSNIQNAEKAQSYAEEILAISTNVNDKSGIGNAYNILGSINRDKNNYLEALKHFLSSAQAFEGAHDTIGKAKAYNNIGNIYRDIQGYEKALTYYQKALTLHTLTRNKESMALTNRNTALIHQYMENYQEAKDSYWTALYIWKRLGNERRMAQIYNDLSIVYDMILEKGEYMNFEAEKQIALNLNLNALEYYKKTNDIDGLAKIYINIGRVYTYQPSELPIHYFHKVLSLPSDRIDPKFKAIAHINLGLAMLHSNEGEKALEHFFEAEQYQTDEKISLVTYEKIAASLEQQGEVAQSIFYYKKLNDLRKKSRQVSWRDELARIEARYAIEYAGL